MFYIWALIKIYQMMKNVILLLFCSIITYGASGQILVKKQEFTLDSKNELEYRGIGVDQILFYVSGEIQLKRVVNIKDEAGAKDKGNVVFENGKALEYKKFTSSATGKADTITGNTIEVRFENIEGAYLKFKKEKAKGSTEEVYKYYLVLNADGKTIDYAGYTWEIFVGKSSYLFWKPKEKTKNKKKKDKVRGLKNDGSEKKTLKDIIKKDE